MNETLIVRTLSNIGYNSAARMIAIILSGCASIVLARNLDSSDYGVVGFATIIIGFMSRFCDLGINSAMVQTQALDAEGLQTGFALKFALGLGVALVAYLLAPLSLHVLDHPSTPSVIRILALNFVLSSFVLLPNCLLMRELDYRRLFVPQVASSIVNSVLAIALAVAGFKFWSIVIASVASNIVSAALLNALRPVRYDLRLNRQTARKFLGFGGQLFGSGLVIFAIFNADNFIIGTIMGASILGFYALAFNWGSMVCNILYETVHNVLFPTLSRLQEDRGQLKKAYLKVLEYTGFVGVMTNVGLFVVSEEFLVLVLGQGTVKWLPALSVMRIFCFYGIVRLLLEPVGNIILALGMPNLLLRANLYAGAIELSLLYPVLKTFGLEGVAVLVTIAYGSQYLIYFAHLRRSFNLSISEVSAAILPAIACGVALLGLWLLVQQFIQGPTWTLLLGKVIACIIIYNILFGLMTEWRLFRESRVLIVDIIEHKIRSL